VSKGKKKGRSVIAPAQFSATDRQIDGLVYEQYGLTEDKNSYSRDQK
jgi:hypothetical protein